MTTRRPLAIPKSRPRLYVGEWIAALSLKQNEVATGAGITESYLSEIIGPKQKMPSLEVLKAIADAMDLPIQRLFNKPPPDEAVRSVADIDPGTLARLRSRRKNLN